MGAASERERIEMREPPFEWYYGAGRKDAGIQVVTNSESFAALGDGVVGREYGQWCHFTGNPPSEGDGREQRVTEALQQAETVIFEITGFSPREIWNKRTKLHEEYKGKTSAPFEYDLF